MQLNFIFIPVAFYLLFAGLFIQQALTNFQLARTGLSIRRSYLLYFTIASAAFCLSLLMVLLSPAVGFSADGTRWSFFVCWIIAPVAGYLYALTLAQHLEIPHRRIRWINQAYFVDFCFIN